MIEILYNQRHSTNGNKLYIREVQIPKNGSTKTKGETKICLFFIFQHTVSDLIHYLCKYTQNQIYHEFNCNIGVTNSCLVEKKILQKHKCSKVLWNIKSLQCKPVIQQMENTEMALAFLSNTLKKCGLKMLLLFNQDTLRCEAFLQQ